MKHPPRRAVTERHKRKTSFAPLRGLEEEVKVVPSFHNKSICTEEIKTDVTNTSTQYLNDTKNFGVGTESVRMVDANVATKSKKYEEIGCTTDKLPMNDVETETEVKEVVDAEINTHRYEYVETGVNTQKTLSKDTWVNTHRVHYIDSNDANTIAQNWCYLILQEKELENEIAKNNEKKRTQRLYSKFYEDILPEDKMNLLEYLKDKFLNFSAWNVESIEDKCLVYSSKTPYEMIRSKQIQNNNGNSLRNSTAKRSSMSFTSIVNTNRKVGVCLFLLSIYLFFSVNGFNLVGNTILCLLLPLLLITSVFNSQISEEKTERATETVNSENSLYKVKTKFNGQPDDIAFALWKPNHRKEWDLNIVSFLQEELSPVFNKNLNIQYQSYEEGTFTEHVSYNFYKEEDGVFYILEETNIDRFTGEKNHRLFEIKHQVDSQDQSYYSLWVYGQLTDNLVNHKTERGCKLDYVKGLVVYVENATDLPSSQIILQLSKTPSLKIEGERLKVEGRNRFSFKKTNESLEQINESAELGEEDEIEEYKMSQIGMKDTLLTVDEFNSIDCESDGYDIDLQDKLYEEVDDILRTESDDLSQIKNEALSFDKRNGRYPSRDSIASNSDTKERKHSPKKLSSDNEVFEENSFKEKANDLTKNLEAFIDLKTIDEVSDESRKLETKDEPTKDNWQTKAEKDSNGAVASPYKNSYNVLNPTLGTSTVDFNFKPKANLKNKF